LQLHWALRVATLSTPWGAAGFAHKFHEGMMWGMVDEDPGAALPPYLKILKEKSREHGVPVLIDEERNNSIIMLSPRLEDWLVQTAKNAGLKMTDFGFESDNGVQLHAEINQRLGSLQQLVKALLDAKNPRLTRLQFLLKQV